MNIFKDFTLKWWQAGIFKIALLSLGIIMDRRGRSCLEDGVRFSS